MADNEKEGVEGATPRGVDWEVVTLTESTYAAAPGPGGTAGKPTVDSTDLGASKGVRGSSNALLMSDHFVFPPSEHENLPIETNFDEIQPQKDVHEATTSMEDTSFKNVGGKYDVESETIQFYDEGKNLSLDDVQIRGAVPDYGSIHAEDDGHGFVHDDGGDDSHDKLDLPSESAGRKSRDSGAPCKCWLKKHMSCLYHQAKETNALWSVVVAAALVGLVILGRWHKDKLHLNQLKWRSCSAVRG